MNTVGGISPSTGGRCIDFDVRSPIEKLELSHSYLDGVNAVFADISNRPSSSFLKAGILGDNILELNFDPEEPVIGLYGF